VLANPQPHIGKEPLFDWSALEKCAGEPKALGPHDHLIIPVEPLGDGLRKRGLPVHLGHHLATMAMCTARDAAALLVSARGYKMA